MFDADTGRYAVYFFPDPESQLARLGQVWLGRTVDDPHYGAVVPPDDLPAEIEPTLWAEITQFPRRYGFHATLKAPFRLARDQHLAALEHSLADLAAKTRPFNLPILRVTDLAGFLALCFLTPSPGMDALAERCVVDLDRFRAPLTQAERKKRRPDKLPVPLLSHLDEWGYPYVLDAFQFHMTLTNKLPDDVKIRLMPVLRRYMAPVCQHAIKVDSISLFHQSDPDAPFVMVRQFPFAAEPE
jgi:2'-5' RNA ligase